MLFLVVQTNGQEYNFISYGINEGLPTNNIADVLADQKDHLWIATNGGGLVRFDGKSFYIINSRQGLPSDQVRTAKVSADNTIWIGTDKGLSSFKVELETIAKIKKRVNSIQELNSDRLLIGSDSCLLVYNTISDSIIVPKSFVRFINKKIIDIQSYRSGFVISTSLGLFHLSSDLKQSHQLLSHNVQDQINALKLNEDGTAWFITSEGVLYHVDINNEQILNVFKRHSIKTAQHLFEDENQTLWISTQNSGIQLFDPLSESWSSLTQSGGLPSLNIKGVFQDKWKTLWIYSNSSGLHKYLGQNFTHYNRQSGLDGSRIYSILKDRKGAIWITTNENGISKITSDGSIINDIDQGLIQKRCVLIAEKADGSIWMNCPDQGILRYDSSGMNNMTDSLSLPQVNPHAQIYFDSTLLLGTSNSDIISIQQEESGYVVNKISNGNLKNSDASISTFFPSSPKDIWFGTTEGHIGYLNDKEFVLIENSQSTINEEIRSIILDKNNLLWIGTSTKGIYQLIRTKEKWEIEPFTQNELLSSLTINQLLLDHEDNLWIGGNQGLDKLTMNASGHLLNIEHFGRNNGFTGIVTTRNSSIIDEKNNLWFGTMNGLAKHHPDASSSDNPDIQVHFIDIGVDYKSIRKTKYQQHINHSDSLTQNASFDYRDNNISFRYKGISFDYPNDILYKWRLQGQSENWSDATKEESINFNNLSPGFYKFQCQAIGKKGLESEIISTSFLIKAPLWKKTWFQISMSLLGLILLFSLYKIRIKYIKNKEAQKRQDLELKNELLNLEQKALQLQMNPHFIFNALNSIQGLIVREKTSDARKHLQQFAKLMRTTLSNSKKEKLTLEEEITSLELYLNIEQFCQPDTFDYAIKTNLSISTDEILLPPMLLQPIVENAIIHGVKNSSEHGQIKISFSTEGQLLICKVEDNGLGINKTKSLTTKPQHQSVALNVTQERLKSLKLNRRYQEFTTEEKQGASGTIVTLRLPLELLY